MKREIKGIEALSKSLPQEWLLYVALNCFPRGQDPMEIDAIVVMDDRVLILEIKDWNGKLTHQNDRWLIGRQNRGRSAVIQASEKAKKLKTVLKGELGAIGSQLYVDHRVVLTGSATKQFLHPSETYYVWSLNEACSIATPTKKRELLKQTKLGILKLYQLETEFEKAFGNTKLFQPLEADWSGYQVIEPDLFKHPKGVWSDHRAERKAETRLKAIVRTWSFENLPVGLNSPDRRQFIALRETKAFAHLQEKESSLVSGNKLLREISTPHEEISTHHFEIRAISQGWSTLDRYLERAHEDLSVSDRLVITSGMLNIVSQLHQHQISHRDLGARCLWIGSPSDISATGLMCSQIPDQESVVDWLTSLRGYSPDLPEDISPNSTPSTGQQRDVYMCAYLATLILTGSPPGRDSSSLESSLPPELLHLKGWITKGLSEAPHERYCDAITMTEDFSNLIEGNQRESIDQSLLDRFETNIIPYQRWPMKSPLSTKASCSVYITAHDSNSDLTVKVWNGVLRGLSTATDLALFSLLDSAHRLKSSPIPGVPKFLDTGLSPIGPYVIYEYCEGTPIDKIENLSPQNILSIALQILNAVTALHDLGCDHGDISPSNIIFNEATNETYILDPFDISPVGSGEIRTPAMCPPNWERMPQQSLDRYAALKIITNLLTQHPSDQTREILTFLLKETERPIIESLEPALHSIKECINRINTPPTSRFKIYLKNTPSEYTTGRGFYLSRTEPDADTEQFTLTSPHIQIIIEGDRANSKSLKHQKPHFTALAHASVTGQAIDIEVEIEESKQDSFNDIYHYLRDITGQAKIQTSPLKPKPHSSRLDVERHWRTIMDLEEQDRIEIELTRLIASSDGTSIYKYENTRKEFDFDPDDTVEVYSTSNKRIGEVEYSLSSFPGTIAIRGNGRRLSEGDIVQLVDRRAQTSIDRRTKAVDRILDRRSAIPDLIDYFHSNTDKHPTDFEVEIPEEDLKKYNLNEGQKSAFRKLLRYGPVGLLQGPPGTGKTRFIASFVHWLLTTGGSQRILIASQSHEAVNNAIESLLSLYKQFGGRPNLLRIGSKGITEKIKPYHSAELRERYRVRFEAAAKFRYSQLTSAKGIARPFASELFDLDSSVGLSARRCYAAQNAGTLDLDESSPERERTLNQIARLESAFHAAAKQTLGREVNVKLPLEELDYAVEELTQKHTGVSPADANSARKSLTLTRDWLSALSSPQRNFEEFLAKTRNIVTATCVGVGQTKIRIDTQIFDWVIVDEAARCTPGELAVPIQMARRVLLVGDHLQLKPMLSRDIAYQLSEKLGEVEAEQVQISDFERTFTSPYGNTIGSRFTEQYRMDPAICKMVSSCFYEPHEVKLETSPMRQQGISFDSSTSNILKNPITWIDTSAHPEECEKRPAGETTRHNNSEIEAILRTLEIISEDKEITAQLYKLDEETPIGVICMYAGQKRKLEIAWAKHAWDPKFRRMVRIDTVDSYQGKENSIVILSLVASNHINDTGHVGSPNRCNVAVSRAKDRLIIIGSARMWSSVSNRSPMSKVLHHLKSHPEHSKVIPIEDLS